MSKRNYRSDKDFEAKIQEELAKEAKRIRERLRYEKDKAKVIAQSKEWRKNHPGYIPKKYHHLPDPKAAYNADKQAKRRAWLASLTEEQRQELRAKNAEWHRKKREAKGDEVRAYHREYFRNWVKENPDKAAANNLKSAIKRKVEEDLQKAIERRSTKNTKKKK